MAAVRLWWLKSSRVEQQHSWPCLPCVSITARPQQMWKLLWCWRWRPQVRRFTLWFSIWECDAECVSWVSLYEQLHCQSFESCLALKMEHLKKPWGHSLQTADQIRTGQNRNPSLAFGQPALQFHLPLAISSPVNSGTHHERFQSGLPTGQVTTEIWLPDHINYC